MEKKFYFGKIELVIFAKVYEPREDSFLLAKAVSAGKNSKALDLGTGSGIQAINAAILGANVLATDINENAIANSKSNAEKLKLGKKIKFLKSDLFQKIPEKEKFDCIIFNPPYVPCDEIKFIESDGGKKGREILDRFLKVFPKHLKKSGKCFFLQSSLNGIEKTEKILKKEKFEFEIVAREKLFFEELVVFKAWTHANLKKKAKQLKKGRVKDIFGRR